MKINKILLLVIMLLAIGFSRSEAKSRLMPKMYAYGFALSLTDSTVYLTNITTVDSVWVDDRTGFVINRSDYTSQFDAYLSVVDLTKTMTVVVLGKTEKAVRKKWNKLHKRYTNKKKGNYKIVSIDGFMLQSVEPSTLDLQRKVIKAKSAKTKKARREKVKTITNQ